MLRSIRLLFSLCCLLLLGSGCQLLIDPTRLPDAAPADLVEPAVALEPEFLFNIQIELAAPRDIGSIPELGVRHLYYFAGGSFAGPAIQGEVLAGGENWFLIRNNCVCDLYIQGQLQTDDGAIIDFVGHGYSRTTPAIRQAIMAGAAIESADYAFRGVPFFESSDPDYAWLNTIVTVATYRFEPDRVTLSVYAIR